MKKSILRLAAPALIAVAALVPSIGQAASLGSLNLKLSDFPKGFAMSYQHVWTNAQSAKLDHTTVANLERRGRLLSEERVFKTKIPLQGFIEVDTSVAKYRSAAGVMWVYGKNKSFVAHFKKGNRPFVPLNIGHIASVSAGYTDTYTLGSFKYNEDIIFFREGRYFVDMDFAGLSPLFKPAVAIHLAKVVDARIRRSR